MPPALLYQAPACFGCVIKTWCLSCMIGLRVTQQINGFFFDWVLVNTLLG